MKKLFTCIPDAVLVEAQTINSKSYHNKLLNYKYLKRKRR